MLYSAVLLIIYHSYFQLFILKKEPQIYKSFFKIQYMTRVRRHLQCRRSRLSNLNSTVMKSGKTIAAQRGIISTFDSH